MFWTRSSNMNLHEIAHSSSFSLMSTERTNYNLLWQLVVNKPCNQRSVDSQGNLFSSATRVCTETKKISLECYTENRVLRGSSENSSVNFRINKTNRLVVFNYSISISSTKKFQVSATAANTSIKNTRVILQKSDSKQKPQGRTQNLKICNGCYLILSHSQVLIQADASKKGWGTVC